MTIYANKLILLILQAKFGDDALQFKLKKRYTAYVVF